jgi:hypothetical protein
MPPADDTQDPMQRPQEAFAHRQIEGLGRERSEAMSRGL